MVKYAVKFHFVRMKRQKIVLSREGPFMNVLKLKPPMPFSCANVDEVS